MKSLRRNQFTMMVLVLISLVMVTSYGYESQVSAAEQQKPILMKFASTSVGSAWYLYAGSIAESIRPVLPQGSSIEVLPAPGGMANPPYLSEGKCQIALGVSFATKMAFEGTGPYNKKTDNLRAIVSLHDNYMQSFSVRAESKITSFKQIKETQVRIRIATSSPAATDYWATKDVLQEYGMTEDDIKKWGGSITQTGVSAILDGLRDGIFDMASWSVTRGHPGFTELANTTAIRFIPLDEDVINRLAEKRGYTKTKVPAGIFKGVREDAPGIGFQTFVMVTNTLPDELVYNITKAIVEDADRIRKVHSALQNFTRENAGKGAVIPLHPGAIKYYKEQGLL